MPSIGFWFTGKSLFFAFSFFAGMFLSIWGHQKMSSNKRFIITLAVILFLTVFAWYIAAKDEEESANQNKIISEMSNSMQTIARIFSVNPNQPIDIMMSQIANRISALEIKTEPRQLSDNQKLKIISTLKPHAKKNVNVRLAYHSGDSKSYDYVSQWEKVLISSDWNVADIRQVLEVNPSNFFKGIRIKVKSEKLGNENGAGYIQKIMNDLGENTYGVIDENLPDNLIEIFIGFKE